MGITTSLSERTEKVMVGKCRPDHFGGVSTRISVSKWFLSGLTPLNFLVCCAAAKRDRSID
jgi:hypothetical protein